MSKIPIKSKAIQILNPSILKSRKKSSAILISPDKKYTKNINYGSLGKNQN